MPVKQNERKLNVDANLENGKDIAGISRNVIIMGLVSFFNDIASEMIYPLVPIFLTTILMVPVTFVGIIEGIAESIGSILKVFSGWISDKLQNRKPLVVAGYALSSLSKLLLAFSFTWILVLIARFADRVGKGVRTSPRDALIAESSAKNQRGISFGLHRALDTLGAVVGPLLAIILLKATSSNFNLIFFVAFIPAIIGVLLLIIFVKEKAKTPLKVVIPVINIGKFGRPFFIFLIVSCIFAIGNSSDAFLILRAKNLGFSSTLTILTYVAFNLTYSIFATPAGAVSDRIGAKKVLLIGFALFSLVYLFFGLIVQREYVWLLFPAYGIYMALTEGVGKAYIANLVPQENAGVAFGVYQTATGVCTLFASIFAGLMWTHINVQAPFIFGSIMAILAGLLFLLM